MTIVAMICVSLLRDVDSAWRTPSWSQGEVYQATALGEKFVPAITTGWLMNVNGGALAFHRTPPESTDAIVAVGFVTNIAAAFEGARFGWGLATVICKT